jgi:hypothetical protein
MFSGWIATVSDGAGQSVTVSDGAGQSVTVSDDAGQSVTVSDGTGQSVWRAKINTWSSKNTSSLAPKAGLTTF